MTSWKRLSFMVTLTLLLGAVVLTPNTSWAVDSQRALAVWHQQAEQGNAEAQNSIGDCYANGWGVAKDPAEAMKWYRKAADQNYRDAQFNIGNMYEQGTDIRQDLVQAYLWESLAATDSKLGDPYAGRFKLLAEKMTPEQIAEGKRLAAAWKPTSAPSANLTSKADHACTPSVSDFQALALSPSQLTLAGFSALTPARQKMVCSTRAFSKQVELQAGFIDKVGSYSTKYLSPAENDLIDDASNDYLSRIFKSKGF